MYEGFVIKCLECGSDEVWVHDDIDYDYNIHSTINNSTFKCKFSAIDSLNSAINSILFAREDNNLCVYGQICP